jgi:hypothetical protein
MKYTTLKNIKYFKNRKIKIWSAIVFSTATLIASGAQKTYRASWLNPAPVISGTKVYDDPAWKDIAYQDDFIELASKKNINGKFKFFAGFTSQGINIRVETPWRKKSFPKAARLFEKDGIEIFLASVPNSHSYRQFVLTMDGCKWDAEYKATTRSQSNKLSDWTGTVNPSKHGLIFNFLIPYKTLKNLPPADKKYWKLNVAAHETGDKDRFYSWCNLANRFHEPRHFARLTAETIPGNVRRDLQEKMKIWNFHHAVELLKNQARKIAEHIETAQTQDMTQSWVKEKADLKSISEGLSKKLTPAQFEILNKRLGALEKQIGWRLMQQQKRLHEEIMQS